MSAKKSLNWKEVGQFVAALVNLFSVITVTLKKIKVGAEVIDWATGPGKSFFVKKLKEIGEEFLRQTTPILRAVIDTNNDPRLPFANATIEKHARQGKISIEKRFDGLYLDGQKVVLYRSTRQIGQSSIIGYELRKDIDGQPVLSASVLDFIMANKEYIPEEWKEKDEKGNIILIFFWDTIFRRSDGDLCVRCLYWDGSQWYVNYLWLDSGFTGHDPAAVFASISA
ncbi:MAG: hypothetical protein WCT16_00210 [Candidatus Buchananbacteria bacterium]